MVVGYTKWLNETCDNGIIKTLLVILIHCCTEQLESKNSLKFDANSSADFCKAQLESIYEIILNISI